MRPGFPVPRRRPRSRPPRPASAPGSGRCAARGAAGLGPWRLARRAAPRALRAAPRSPLRALAAGEGEGQDPDPRPTGPGGLPHLRRDGDGAGSLQLSRGRGARARLHSLPGPAGLRRAQPPHGGRVAPVQCLQGHGARRHRAARRRWRRRPGREGHRRRGLGLAHRPGAGASLRRAPHWTLSSLGPAGGPGRRPCRPVALGHAPPRRPRGRLRRITRVSHLGFIVQRSGHTYLRHATRGWKDGWWTRSSHLLARHARYAWRIQACRSGRSATRVPPPTVSSTTR